MPLAVPPGAGGLVGFEPGFAVRGRPPAWPLPRPPPRRAIAAPRTGLGPSAPIRGASKPARTCLLRRARTAGTDHPGSASPPALPFKPTKRPPGMLPARFAAGNTVLNPGHSVSTDVGGLRRVLPARDLGAEPPGHLVRPDVLHQRAGFKGPFPEALIGQDLLERFGELVADIGGNLLSSGEDGKEIEGEVG